MTPTRQFIEISSSTAEIAVNAATEVRMIIIRSEGRPIALNTCANTTIVQIHTIAPPKSNT